MLKSVTGSDCCLEFKMAVTTFFLVLSRQHPRILLFLGRQAGKMSVVPDNALHEDQSCHRCLVCSHRLDATPQKRTHGISTICHTSGACLCQALPGCGSTRCSAALLQVNSRP